MTTGYPLLFAGVLLNAAAQLLLKAGTNAVGRFEFVADNIVPVATRLAFEPHIAGGMLCYAVSLVVWIMGLSRVEVSIAYPMLSIGYVVSAIAAYFLFERGVYVTLAAYPLVPKHEVGFRVQVTAANTDEEISHLIATVRALADRFQFTTSAPSH
jgi:multidrug transporter EmrE-like cation transporter